MKKRLALALAASIALPAAAAQKKGTASTTTSKQPAATATAVSAQVPTPAPTSSAATSSPTPTSAPPAAPTPPPVPPDSPGSPYALAVSASAAGGAFDGMGVRSDSGSMVTLAVAGTPELRREAWSVEAPFRLFHRETFGASLSETSAAADVTPWLQATESLRLGIDAGLVGVSKPDWPDLYQPDPAAPGALLPTDRYSYLEWRAGAQAYARPARHQHLRARYRYASYDYKDDPNFNPNAVPGGGPMHLTPGDHVEHQIDVSWSYRRPAWAVVLRLDHTRRNEEVLLARTAGTGSTRAGGPGTPLYTTPLERTSLWEPSAELRLEPTRSLELSLRYGVDVQDDHYQGYYSFTQQHPRVAARWAATRRLAVEARYEGWIRTYGSNGTAPDRLDYGTRRTSARIALAGEAGYVVAKGLRAVASVEWIDRGTNYPDYVSTGPNANSSYDIDWDYTNYSVLAGLEYRL